jgi:hypothetical protein
LLPAAFDKSKDHTAKELVGINISGAIASKKPRQLMNYRGFWLFGRGLYRKRRLAAQTGL